MSDAILEFQTHEELGPLIIDGVQDSTIELLGSLEAYQSRQKIHKTESAYLAKHTPNTWHSIRYLADSYADHATPELNKKAQSNKPKHKRRVNNLRNSTRNYFIFGSSFGSLAYRLQSGILVDNKESADLPDFWLDEFKNFKQADADEFFYHIDQSDEDKTWPLSNLLIQSKIGYRKPFDATKGALLAGAQTVYHLHSTAKWHKEGVEHPFSPEIMEIFTINSYWNEFELYKSAIRNLLRSTPAQVRQYKELSQLSYEKQISLRQIC